MLPYDSIVFVRVHAKLVPRAIGTKAASELSDFQHLIRSRVDDASEGAMYDTDEMHATVLQVR